ncbi:MAG: DUF1178 family protein [Pseudomonadota bacterium]
MIRYAMRCAKGHSFDGWFRDGQTFDRLQAAGQISCTVCGCAEVEKALMAPAIAPSRRSRPEMPDMPEGVPPGMSHDRGAEPVSGGPAMQGRRGGHPAAQSGAHPAAPRVPGQHVMAPQGSAAAPDLAALRAKIEAVSDDVGSDFAAEARRIHDGEAPARPILGEATAAEAKALVADDIPVVPLPWWQRRND